jgi:hypothetical protein
LATEIPASDQLEESKVDETNYPGAPESQDVEEKETSQPEQPAKTEASTKPDWRVEKYGEDWENNAAYWKDTSSYWHQEYKKKSARTFESLDEPERKAARSNQQSAELPAGEVDPDEITSVKDLITHMRGEVERTFDEKLSARQVQDRFSSSMRAAREEYKGDPDAGIPSFTDLEQEILIPLCEKQPQILQLIKSMEDPKAAAYTLGMMLKLQGGFMDVLRGQGRAELTDKINAVSKQAVRLKNGGNTGRKSGKQTAADIWNMSKEEFEKQSAAVINSRG